MQRAHALAHPADYVLRAQHNRCLPQGGKLWPATLATPSLGEIEFTLGACPGNPHEPYARPFMPTPWRCLTVRAAPAGELSDCPRNGHCPGQSPSNGAC